MRTKAHTDLVDRKSAARRRALVKQDLVRDLSEPVVYAAVADLPGTMKFVKVGFSSGLLARLADLQTGCPVPISAVSYVRAFSVERARNIEAAIHLLMAEHRSSGEWFRFDLSNPKDLKAWRGAIPAVLNEVFGSGRWNLKSFNYAGATASRRRA